MKRIFPFSSFRLTAILIAMVLIFQSAPASSMWAQEAPEENPKESVDDAETGDQEPTTDEPQSGDDEAGDAEANQETGERGTDSAGKAPDTEDRGSRRRRRSDISRTSGRFLEVFKPIAESADPATVRIKSGEDTIALGAIVDPSGFVLTKQSELRSPLACELSDGSVVSARVYGVHEPTDLALLKIDVNPVPVVRWSQGNSLDIGNWLITVRGADEKPAVGVVGVQERLIKPKSGFMGVNLAKEDDFVTIINVSPDTPAYRAGIKRGDAILEIEGEAFGEVNEVIEHVQSFAPGDEITLRLKRKDKEIVLEVELGDAESLNPLFERSNQQNTMGGNILSKRRQDFPLAVQHDTLLKPQECGGPVVNIDGEVVGINIARQGRVASLMLPTSTLLPVIAELKTGKLAPPLANQARIDEINMALQKLRNTLNLSPVDSDSARESLEAHEEAEKTARQNLDKALKELDEARDARLRAEIAMQNAVSEFDNAKKEIESLEKELQELVSGTR